MAHTDPAFAASTGPSLRRAGGWLALLWLALAVPTAHAAGAPAAAGPAQPAAAASGSLPADCEDLLKQFDVAWPAHRRSERADGARRSRDLGEADCKAGRHADGVRNLRRALHDIGVKPVKHPPSASAR